jgi:hypothetical protein
MYGSPGNSDQAVNVYMEKLARQSGKAKLKVFNLAFPSKLDPAAFQLVLPQLRSVYRTIKRLSKTMSLFSKKKPKTD